VGRVEPHPQPRQAEERRREDRYLNPGRQFDRSMIGSCHSSTMTGGDGFAVFNCAHRPLVNRPTFDQSHVHAFTPENLMTVRPLHDRIIVDRLDDGEQQIGGIIIPDSAKEKPQRGTVVAAGNGRVAKDGTLIPLDVKAGDQVLFGKYSGQEIRLDGKDLFIMKEDDVLAIIDDPKKKK
jgi:chaperonin GroES